MGEEIATRTVTGRGDAATKRPASRVATAGPGTATGWMTDLSPAGTIYSARCGPWRGGVRV